MAVLQADGVAGTEEVETGCEGKDDDDDEGGCGVSDGKQPPTATNFEVASVIWGEMEAGEGREIAEASAPTAHASPLSLSSSWC